MFIDRLEQLSSKIGTEVQMLSLVAKDGIPVETVPASPAFDVELLAAEFMAQVSAISKNHQELDVGRVRQLTVATERMTVMASAVSEDYFLLLVLAGETPQGRARFELRRATLAFEDDLA